MEQIIYNIRHCTGCAACSQVCPCGAVVMEADEEGFLFPKIKEERCNDCGLCRRTCPVNTAFEKTRSIVTDTDGSSVFTAGGNGVPVFVSREGDAAEAVPDDTVSSPIVSSPTVSSPTVSSPTVSSPSGAFSGKRAFACWSKNDAIREKSSSGGIFSELAAKTLEDGGVVFGAAFDSDFSVRHRCIENIDDLDELRRSKYVQSEIGESFKEAEKYLEEGRKVLFCGTPCQIAGLKAYLGKEYDNLTTCDIACFGVPSPKVWRMFLDYLEDRYGGGITSVSFRDKSTGWRESSVRITFDNGAKYMVSVKKELYLMGYFKNLFTRKSCFDCRFKVHTSHADLTLADFWGIEKLEDP
ncbi:MAG: 4Fe-4S dicluster domain-containing protein, partial [Clostridiaceae bacterium]|nr:4Fe-4S dicluster domain-containing protein [Clostridiaceae bacterium]